MHELELEGINPHRPQHGDPAVKAHGPCVLSDASWHRMRASLSVLQTLMAKQDRKTLPGMRRYSLLQRAFEQRRRRYFLVDISGAREFIGPLCPIAPLLVWITIPVRRDWARWGYRPEILAVSLKGGKRHARQPKLCDYVLTLREAASVRDCPGLGRLIAALERMVSGDDAAARKAIERAAATADLRSFERLPADLRARIASYLFDDRNDTRGRIHVATHQHEPSQIKPVWRTYV